jgi:GH25 family lysozyme M1 (1,4-beta-N-acetylmuramidase)
MKTFALLALALPTIVFAAQPKGIDVSHWQGSINWGSIKASGVEFVYIKATESTSA